MMILSMVLAQLFVCRIIQEQSITYFLTSFQNSLLIIHLGNQIRRAHV